MSVPESTSVFQRISRFLVFAVLAATATAGGCDSDNYPLLSQMLISENGYYMAELATDPLQPVVKGPQSASLYLMDSAQEPITGATIDVEPWMPSMSHGSTETPVVSEDGDGMYTITNIVFTMHGPWELRIDVSADGADDRIVATYEIAPARSSD
ncbi:MAG: FixH family protein, partial [Chrysiogenetes bacterium]|nr:FixH family protein [Chrysiogenetes bacterium]